MASFDTGAYWEDRLRGKYNEQGVGDIGVSHAYNRHLYRVRRRVFRRCLKRLPLDPHVTRVLDVGSGTGVYVDEWKRWGVRDLTGIDISDTAVDRLSTRFPGFRFLCADIGIEAATHLLEGQYDVASAFDVLFHVVDDERYQQALRNIFAALRPGGWFLYSDNFAHREARLSHYVSRSESDILASLSRSGFDVVARVPMFVLMNDPVRTRSRALRRWYSLVHRVAARGETAGQLLGAALLPLEIALTRMVRRGPATEILLCRTTPQR